MKIRFDTLAHCVGQVLYWGQKRLSEPTVHGSLVDWAGRALMSPLSELAPSVEQAAAGLLGAAALTLSVELPTPSRGAPLRGCTGQLFASAVRRLAPYPPMACPGCWEERWTCFHGAAPRSEASYVFKEEELQDPQRRGIAVLGALALAEATSMVDERPALAVARPISLAHTAGLSSEEAFRWLTSIPVLPGRHAHDLLRFLLAARDGAGVFDADHRAVPLPIMNMEVDRQKGENIQRSLERDRITGRFKSLVLDLNAGAGPIPCLSTALLLLVERLHLTRLAPQNRREPAQRAFHALWRSADVYGAFAAYELSDLLERSAMGPRRDVLDHHQVQEIIAEFVHGAMRRVCAAGVDPDRFWRAFVQSLVASMEDPITSGALARGQRR